MTMQNSLRKNYMGGFLGRHTESYQRTLRCKSGESAWKEVYVEASPEARVQISFDGRAYEEPITVRRGGAVRLYLAARAVRVKVRRSQDSVKYSVVCRD